MSRPATSASDGLRAAAAPIWEAQHEHPFVRGIGNGSLPEERFRHYVRQDYLFLIEYGRLLALACARAPDLETMRRFADLAQAILREEMEMHRSFAVEWGIAAGDLEAERPTTTTGAYTDFLLRTAALGDFAELVAALLPCMWGYSEIARRLRDRGLPDHALYARWIEMYAGADFTRLAGWCRDLTDSVAAGVAGAAADRMLEAFVMSSRHELAFWDASWRLEGAAGADPHPAP